MQYWQNKDLQTSKVSKIHESFDLIWSRQYRPTLSKCCVCLTEIWWRSKCISVRYNACCWSQSQICIFKCSKWWFKNYLEFHFSAFSAGINAKIMVYNCIEYHTVTQSLLTAKWFIILHTESSSKVCGWARLTFFLHSCTTYLFLEVPLKAWNRNITTVWEWQVINVASLSSADVWNWFLDQNNLNRRTAGGKSERFGVRENSLAWWSSTKMHARRREHFGSLCGHME